ncbi:MAG TPA: hypothetical protein VFQ53_22605 [Kofleriaceae bacterium]|nr:hypothetical protein [Kofleriaceae bacterium]
MADDEHVTGLFEIHIFVEPLDPPADVVERFRAACLAARPPMKALLLALDYTGKGFVEVMQSSRYVEGDVALAREAAHRDAELLRAAGLTVVREKVEALVSDPGVPREAGEAARSPADRYFEFHVLIDGKERALSEADMVALRGLSESLAARFARPVPLSYNALKPAQRFLNLRARGVGLAEAQQSVDEVVGAIGALDLVVKKTIAEYICFDTNRALDNGWLE